MIALAIRGLCLIHGKMSKYGVIFDWDGVVIDSSAAHEQSWELLAAEEGLPLPENHFLLGFGKRNAVIIPGIYKWSDDPQAIQRLGDRKEELYREILRKQGGIGALPGVRELLDGLRAARIPCAIGTSTPRRNIDATLDMLGLHDFFTFEVTAEDVSHGKPDPEVFLKCAEGIGLAPGRCVVIEDATYGIEAGLRGGFKVLGVATTNPASKLEAAHRVVNRLTDVDTQSIMALIDG